jgi:hypothetical protein
MKVGQTFINFALDAERGIARRVAMSRGRGG